MKPQIREDTVMFACPSMCVSKRRVSSVPSYWLAVSTPVLSLKTWKDLVKNQKYILIAAFLFFSNPVRIYILHRLGD